MRERKKAKATRQRPRYELWTERRAKGERWRPVVDYEGLYSVSNFGRVRSERNTTRSKKGAVVTPMQMPNGYLNIGLSAPGYERKTWLVHRLVAEAFLGLPADSKQVNHKNGDKTDNRLCNLEWVTPRDNQQHRFTNLGHKRIQGEANPRGKLTEESAREVLRLWSTRPDRAVAPDHPLSQESLAKRFGIRIHAISRLVRGETWKHLAQ
jgi:hypothetical protein